jgi:hypothetical protein
MDASRSFQIRFRGILRFGWRVRGQRADVALQHEVRLLGPLDGFGDLRVGGVDQVADLAADGLLPIGQGNDVGIDTWIRGGCHRHLEDSRVWGFKTPIVSGDALIDDFLDRRYPAG